MTYDNIMYMKKTCTVCNKEFNTFPSINQKRCSMECFYKVLHTPEVRLKISISRKGKKTNRYQRGYINKACETCGKEMFTPQSTNRKYCSRICFSVKHKVRMSGENNPNYKGGHLNDNGYRRLSVNNNHKYEHRKIMEDHIGRKLRTEEHVHHIDGDKTNNNIDNLMLFPTNSAHQKYHAEQRNNGSYKNHL